MIKKDVFVKTVYLGHKEEVQALLIVLKNQTSCKQTKMLSNKPKCWQTNQNADKQTKTFLYRLQFQSQLIVYIFKVSWW
jgi:hypothetical protein